VQNGTHSTRLPSRARFGAWVRAGLERSARITVRIVGTREARTLNRRFRGRSYVPNVLTFLYSDARPLQGDIAICAQAVANEAQAFGITAEARYAHLTVHGTLHLQGYDHIKAHDAARMERREARILARLGYAHPYERGQSVVRKRGQRPGGRHER
jgi:probable rRNA maturation factor